MGIDDNPYCCYMEPYYLPGIPLDHVNTIPHPIFEMLGPYQGYRYTKPRIPTSSSSSSTNTITTTEKNDDDGIFIGKALWNVCEKMTGCHWPDF
jgi:hypothetical protein